MTEHTMKLAEKCVQRCSSFVSKTVISSSFSFGLITTALLTAILFSSQAISQTLTATRASSFTYNAQGLLLTETIEPDSPQSCLVTTYGYDSYGNKSSISTAACAGAVAPATTSASVARTATATYAAQTVVVSGISYTSPAGLFATSNANALAQAETKEYDPRFGGITKLVGPNGLATTWVYSLCTDVGATCPEPIN